MKTLVRTIAFVAAAVATPALADDSDSKQILQLLQGMNHRLDDMQGRLEKLEQQAPGSQATTSVKASPEPQKPANAIPGWRVTVLPFAGWGKLGDTQLARVNAPIGPTQFNLHFGNGRVTTQVGYQGIAFFAAKSPGKYTFGIAVDQSRAGRFYCRTQLNVEDTTVIAAVDANEHPFTSSGGIELQQGKYQITYKVACWSAFVDPMNPLKSDQEIEDYKKVVYDVSVLGPDDDQPRDFTPDELFILKK